MQSFDLDAHTPTMSRRLLQRLEALRVALIIVEPGGRATALDQSNALERRIIESEVFRQAATQAWGDLVSPGRRAVALWRGLTLAPVATDSRRRGAAEGNRVLTAMLMSDALWSSDEVAAIVEDEAELEALAEASTGRVASEDEVERLARVITWMQQDMIEADRRGAEVQSMSQQLLESYEELSLLYKFSSSAVLGQPADEFLREACCELQQVAGFTWLGLQLTADDPRLGSLRGRLFAAGHFEGDPTSVRRLAGMLIETGLVDAQPMVVHDAAGVQGVDISGVGRNVLIVGLMREGQPLGVLLAADKADGSPISSIDAKLCNALVNTSAIFLENVMLFEDAQGMFMGTLHALTASIDAKDSYTHGHSERVAILTRQLAEACGLDAQMVERCYLSGLVHDVGKIGVPESVLTKPGPLTDEEFAMIRLHPEIGARILGDIRQMADLVPGVLHHHERWDGNGYPHRLAGEDIPLLGRLIGVADAFDAMISNRSYRDKMNIGDVLAEVRRCAGTHFDPQLAATFLELDFDPFIRVSDQHRLDAVQNADAPVRREAAA